MTDHDFIGTEQAILGNILLKNSLCEQAKVLSDTSFLREAHSRIFRVMRDLADSGRLIDEFTIEAELERWGEPHLVGGSAYVTSLTDCVLPRKDISPLVRSIQEGAAPRGAAKACENLQNLTADKTIAVTALAEAAAIVAHQSLETSAAVPPRNSEETLALRFSREHAGNWRYVERWGHWLYWDGKRWREDDTLAVFDLARAICRRASTECSHDEKTTAVRLAGSATVYAIERLARVDRRHAASVEQWDEELIRFATEQC